METMTTDVDAALERFAALDEKEVAQPWRFRDKPMEVRYALYRTIEDAQEMLVTAMAQPQPESRRILALAQRAFGDLRGLFHDHVVVVKPQGGNLSPLDRGVCRGHGDNPRFVGKQIIGLVLVAPQNLKRQDVC